MSACPLVAEWCQPPSPTKVKALVSQSTLAVRSLTYSPNLTDPADSDPLDPLSIPKLLGETNPRTWAVRSERETVGTVIGESLRIATDISKAYKVGYLTTLRRLSEP